MASSPPGLPLPLRPSRSLSARFAAAGGVSLAAWVLLQLLVPPPLVPWSPAMAAAAHRMEDGIQTLARVCAARGVAVDPDLDPNRTCLVGPEITELFTTLGQLEAKRSTLNPDVAGLLVHFLQEAGVGLGDRVAVGASGSFPGLLLATLTAVEALDARPLAILSLGASSYGATRPDFHLLDIHRALLAGGIVSTPPAALSLGGSGDVGGEFEPAFRESLLEELRRSGIPVLEVAELRAGVAARMAVYRREGEEIAAFVNIGGSDANLGSSPRILEVPAGLTRELAARVDLPPPEERGVLFEMGARGIPVIHLLNLRGLALRHGLPWDPFPLPPPGTTPLRSGEEAGGWRFWLLSAAYLGALVGLALPRSRARPAPVGNAPPVR